MKIEVSKKDLEKLYDSNNYDELFKIFAMCSSLDHAQRFKHLLSNNKIDLTKDQTKKYVVNEIIKAVRFYNKTDDYLNFSPHIEEKKFFLRGKNESRNLTKEEQKYLKQFKSNIKECKKQTKGNISKEAYDTLKQLYDLDKDEYYIGIHRTNYFVDDIFEEGLKFGSDPNLQEMVQIMHNFDVMLSEISICEGYKHSMGCFIIKIPKKALNEKNVPIYYIKDDSLYLDPRYVAAYAPVKNKKVLPVELNEQMNNVTPTICEEQVVKLKGERNRYH